MNRLDINKFRQFNDYGEEVGGRSPQSPTTAVLHCGEMYRC